MEPDIPDLQKTEKAFQKEKESYIEQARETLEERVAANKGQFSETLNIEPSGSLGLTDENGNLKSYFAHVAYPGVEELYQLAYEVVERNPNLAFTFVRDPAGQSITYTVRENAKEKC